MARTQVCHVFLRLPPTHVALDRSSARYQIFCVHRVDVMSGAIRAPSASEVEVAVGPELLAGRGAEQDELVGRGPPDHVLRGDPQSVQRPRSAAGAG